MRHPDLHPSIRASLRRRLLTAGVVVVAGIALAGCSKDGEATGGAGGGGQAKGQGQSQQQAAQREPVEVALGPVTQEPVERTVEVTGTLYGDEEAAIGAKVAGRIREVLADVGDRVGNGEPLARIDPTDYELVVEQREMALRETLAELGVTELPGKDFNVSKVPTVARARSQAANATAKLERARKLHEQRPPLISDQEFADIETANEVAAGDYEVAVLTAGALVAQARTRHAELLAAQQQLADTFVRAPGVAPGAAVATNPAPATNAAVSPAATTASGSTGGLPRFGVTQRVVSQGEYVRIGDPLFRVVADDPIKFRAAVPERFLSDVRVGQDVYVSVESQREPFPGKVSRINPAVDMASRTFQVEALVPNAERPLRPGSFARGRVVIGQDPQVAFVPKAAVVTFAGIDRVFSVNDGKAVEHVVRLGATRGDKMAIEDGLADGVRQVVTTGSQRLSKDVPVTVTQAADGGNGGAASQPASTAAAR